MQDWVEKTSHQDINVAKIRSTLCASPDWILPVRGLLSWAGMADPRVPTMLSICLWLHKKLVTQTLKPRWILKSLTAEGSQLAACLAGGFFLKRNLSSVPIYLPYYMKRESGFVEHWQLTQNMFLISRNRKQRSMDLATGWTPLIYQEEVVSYSSEFEWHLYFFPFFRPKFMQLIIKSTLLSRVWFVFCL